MRPPKINDRVLVQFIDKKKLSQTEAAKRLGVSRQAVSKRLQDLRGKTTKAVIVKRVEEVVNNKIDTMQQLAKINKDANELLDLVMRWQRGDKGALQILESQVVNKKVRVGDQIEYVREYKFKDPRELALRAMAEIRGQLGLQLEIFQTLYDVRAAQEFQKEILEAIGEVSPDVRTKIIDRLNQKRAIRSAVKFN